MCLGENVKWLANDDSRHLHWFVLAVSFKRWVFYWNICSNTISGFLLWAREFIEPISTHTSSCVCVWIRWKNSYQSHQNNTNHAFVISSDFEFLPGNTYPNTQFPKKCLFLNRPATKVHQINHLRSFSTEFSDSNFSSAQLFRLPIQMATVILYGPRVYAVIIAKLIITNNLLFLISIVCHKFIDRAHIHLHECKFPLSKH